MKLTHIIWVADWLLINLVMIDRMNIFSCTVFKFITKHLIINWFSTRSHPDSWLQLQLPCSLPDWLLIITDQNWLLFNLVMISRMNLFSFEIKFQAVWKFVTVNGFPLTHIILGWQIDYGSTLFWLTWLTSSFEINFQAKKEICDNKWFTLDPDHWGARTITDHYW